MNEREEFLRSIDARRRGFEKAQELERAERLRAAAHQVGATAEAERINALKKANQTVLARRLREEARLFAPHLIPGTNNTIIDFQKPSNVPILKSLGVKNTTRTPVWLIRYRTSSGTVSGGTYDGAETYSCNGTGLTLDGELIALSSSGFGSGPYDVKTQTWSTVQPADDAFLVPLVEVPENLTEIHTERTIAAWRKVLLTAIPAS